MLQAASTEEGARTRIHLQTFGCQMNAMDSELVAGELSRVGYRFTDDPERADIFLFNTCSVREHAEDRVYSSLGRLKTRKAEDPGIIVGVLGCMAQKEKDRLLERFPVVDLVCGTRSYNELLDLLEQARAGRRVRATTLDRPLGFDRDVRSRPDRFRAYVSVMRGCDYHCSYCVVPYTRGREVSKPADEVVAECAALVADGVKEITLLGQTVNAYGRRFEDGQGGPDFAGLLERIDRESGIRRLGFITNHPGHVTERFIAALAGLRSVNPYLHLPPQSGSDRILEAMQRRYTRAGYIERSAALRRAVPDLVIAGDFIVGFPSETEEDFQATLSLVEEVGFSGSFAFKYSPRPATMAWRLPDDVSEEVKRERHQRLMEVLQSVALGQQRRRIGARLEVLAEGPSRRNEQLFTGRARGHEIVVFPPEDTRPGELVDIVIEDATALSLRGRKARSIQAPSVAAQGMVSAPRVIGPDRESDRARGFEAQGIHFPGPKGGACPPEHLRKAQ